MYTQVGIGLLLVTIDPDPSIERSEKQMERCCGQSRMQVIQQAVFFRILQLPPVTGRLFLECLGERNHGFADLLVGKRGEPY